VGHLISWADYLDDILRSLLLELASHKEVGILVGVHSPDSRFSAVFIFLRRVCKAFRPMRDHFDKH
jgi:hypothetical protein